MIFSIISLTLGCIFLTIGLRMGIHLFTDHRDSITSTLEDFLVVYCCVAGIVYGAFSIAVGIVLLLT